MPVLLIAALAAATAQPPVEPPAEPQLHCTLPAPTFTGRKPAAPTQHPDLSSASLYLTVDRRVAGCPAPIIVRGGITGR